MFSIARRSFRSSVLSQQHHHRRLQATTNLILSGRESLATLGSNPTQHPLHLHFARSLFHFVTKQYSEAKLEKKSTRKPRSKKQQNEENELKDQVQAQHSQPELQLQQHLQQPEEQKPQKTTDEDEIKWGIFGDIHFQERGLARVVRTGNWIIDTFRKNNVSGVICLGDVLNTRDSVSVQSLSAAMSFFDNLSKIAPVHIILGNHDMNLKHSGRISSLDALDMAGMKSRIHLYKDMKEIEFQGKKCMMIPYQENQDKIRDFILSKNSDDVQQSVAFVHMAIPGSIQRYQRDNKNEFVRKFEQDDSNMPPTYLRYVGRVISGHFHHHHFVTPRILYAGAPMQHHYGDAGDDQRGVLLYYPRQDKVEFIQNPEWDSFRVVRIATETELGDLEQYRDKHVSLIYEAKDIRPEVIQRELVKAGAKEARKHSVAISKVSLPQIRSAADAAKGGAGVSRIYAEDVIESYVSQFKSKFQDRDAVRNLIDIGRDLIKTAEGKSNRKRGLASSTEIFHAKLRSLTIENFLGVQGTIHINLAKMPEGVWFIEGENGAGKSTILEAITWCLFDQMLRSDMKSDFVINDKVKKNCCVTVEFENGITIERFRKYNKEDKRGNGLRVYKNGVYIEDFEKGELKHAQRKLEEDLLGIDYETFTKSIVVGDNTVSLLTSDSKRRRELIEELLEMDRFDDYLQETRAQIRDLEYEISRFEKEDLARITNECMRCDARINHEKERIQTVYASGKERVEQEREFIEEQIQVLAEKRADTEKEIKLLEQQWNRFSQQQLLKSQREIRKLQLDSKLEHLNAIQALQHEVNELVSQKAHLASAKSCQERIRTKQEQLQQVQAKLKETSFDMLTKEKDRATIQDRINEIQELIKQGKCPTCSQDVTHTVMAKPTDDLVGKVNAIDAEIDALSDVEASLFEQIRLIEEQIEEDEAALSAAIAKVSPSAKGINIDALVFHTDQEIERIQRDIEAHKAALEKINSFLDAAPDQPGDAMNDASTAIEGGGDDNEWHYELNFPELSRAMYKQLEDDTLHLTEQRYQLEAEDQRLESMLQESQRIIEEEERRKKELQDQLAHDIQRLQVQGKQRLSLLEFWEKAFDRKSTKKGDIPTMRSYLMDQSVQDLNAILSEYNQFLGADDSLSITFNNELLINEQDYGKRSAGQRKRNDLAIMFALFELVRQRSNFRADFLMLDEVFDALDQRGQESVRSVIGMLASRISKIFVITHSPLVDRSHNIIRVTMSSTGTKMLF